VPTQQAAVILPTDEFACVIASWPSSTYSVSQTPAAMLDEGLWFIPRPYCYASGNSGARVGSQFDPHAVEGFSVLATRRRGFGREGELSDRVLAVFDCILLQGLFHTSELLFASKREPDGIPMASALPRPLVLKHARSAIVTEQTVRTAFEMSDRYLRVLPKRDRFMIEPIKFRRLWAGLSSLRRGTREFVLARRIHDCVQAVEALLMLGRRDIGRTFLERALELTTGTPQTRRALRTAWEIRCADEHMGPTKRRLGNGRDAKLYQRALELAWKMESFAFVCYTKLLADDALLRHFRTDTSIGKFWDPRFHINRQRLWGRVVDLDLFGWIRRSRCGWELGRN